MTTTVGPWEYDAEAGEVIAPKCGYQSSKGVCVVATVEPLDYSESAGNGALIAAAPMMLVRLTLLADACEAMGAGNLARLARDAIRVAKGE